MVASRFPIRIGIPRLRAPMTGLARPAVDILFSRLTCLGFFENTIAPQRADATLFTCVWYHYTVAACSLALRSYHTRQLPLCFLQSAPALAWSPYAFFIRLHKCLPCLSWYTYLGVHSSSIHCYCCREYTPHHNKHTGRNLDTRAARKAPSFSDTPSSPPSTPTIRNALS